MLENQRNGKLPRPRENVRRSSELGPGFVVRSLRHEMRLCEPCKRFFANGVCPIHGPIVDPLEGVVDLAAEAPEDT